jgi:ABC-type phosphate transport system substrate-binding protein
MAHRPLIVAALVLTACGGTTAAPRSCPSQPATGPHAQTGPVAVDADRRQLRAGATVTFTVTVTGPAQYQADCAGPIQLLVNDGSDIRVFAGRSAPGVRTSCGNVQLGAGQRAVYAVAWQSDSTLPDGQYSATVLMGDQPAVTLTVPVAAGASDRPACGTGA